MGPGHEVVFGPTPPGDVLAPPRTSGGDSTLGDVFVTWMPPGDPMQASAEDGYGYTSEGMGYVRYGPNISQTRANATDLSSHESRHVDQWAAANVLAGPFAFPVAYFIDGTFFPGPRNHFERDAGLARGGYPPGADNRPAPLWPQVAGLLILAALIWRRRLRWLAPRRSRGRTAAPRPRARTLPGPHHRLAITIDLGRGSTRCRRHRRGVS